MPSPFPATKGAKMLTVLAGLGFAAVRQKGSHKTLRRADGKQLIFSYKGGDEIAPGVVRDILMKQVGLTKDEALEVIR